MSDNGKRNSNSYTLARVINDGEQEMVDVTTLSTHPANPRRGDLGAVKASIAKFGFWGAIVAQRSTRHVLAGNHRLMAARELGLGEVPVVWVDVSDERARAILAADNRTSDLGGYDDAALAELLSHLSQDDLLDGTGYTLDDLDDLIDSIGVNNEQVEQSAGAGDVQTSVEIARLLGEKWGTARGQVWGAGPHRIMCGDSRSDEDVSKLLGGATIQTAFTSPPYASQRKYDPASGFEPIRPDAFSDWFKPVQASIMSHIAKDGSWFVNIKEHSHDGQRSLYVLDLVIAHVRQWGWRYVDQLNWVHQGLPGTWPNRLKNQFEPIFHFSPSKQVKWRPQNVAHASATSFQYAGALAAASTGNPISFSGSGVERFDGMALPGNCIRVSTSGDDLPHEAKFPIGLPDFFIKLSTDAGDLVYDPFCGSGTTIEAAHALGRVGAGMELSPSYLGVILERLDRMGLVPQMLGD